MEEGGENLQLLSGIVVGKWKWKIRKGKGMSFCMYKYIYVGMRMIQLMFLVLNGVGSEMKMEE